MGQQKRECLTLLILIFQLPTPQEWANTFQKTEHYCGILGNQKTTTNFNTSIAVDNAYYHIKYTQIVPTLNTYTHTEQSNLIFSVRTNGPYVQVALALLAHESAYIVHVSAISSYLLS